MRSVDLFITESKFRMKTIDNPWQRIVLHTLCLCRRPKHAQFHLRGIAREIPLSHLNRDNNFNRADAVLLGFSALVAIATQIAVLGYSQPEPQSHDSDRPTRTSVGKLMSETWLASK